jgi:hypothetical protein
VDRWSRLYQDYGAWAREQDRAQHERAVAEAAQRRFDEWCAQVTDRVMEDIATVARQRAEEFRAHSGRMIQVEYPSHKPIGLGDDGPFMSFMRFGIDGSSVHLYSHRGLGGLPALHFVYTVEEQIPRHRRLVSHPGAFVARRSDDGYELRTIRIQKDDPPATQTTPDELVFRAFELLLGHLRRRA